MLRGEIIVKSGIFVVKYFGFTRFLRVRLNDRLDYFDVNLIFHSIFSKPKQFFHSRPFFLSVINIIFLVLPVFVYSIHINFIII